MILNWNPNREPMSSTQVRTRFVRPSKAVYYLVKGPVMWEVDMAANYTAVVQQHGEWWIGWIEEVPGVNSQGQTREELLANLRDALDEALEMNRAEARAAAKGAYEEVSLTE